MSMVMIVGVLATIHTAIESINRTVLFLMGGAFKLDGRMTDVIALTEHGVDRLQDERTLALQHIIDHGVTGQGVHIASNTPDVQVMHILYPLNLEHVAHKIRHRKFPGNG